MAGVQLTAKQATQASVVMGTVCGATGYLLTKCVSYLNPQIGLINGILIGATYPLVNHAFQRKNSIVKTIALIALEAFNSLAAYSLCNALRIYISFKATVAVSCGLLIVGGIMFGLFALALSLSTAKSKPATATVT